MKLSETGFKSTAQLYSAYVAAIEKLNQLEPEIEAKELGLIPFSDYKNDFLKRANIHDYEVKALISDMKAFVALVQKKAKTVQLPDFV